MSKHTPGPWEYVWEAEYVGAYPCSVSHKVKVGQELLTVGCHGYEWEPGKEIEANARLMAAAPEMYEALHKIMAEARKGAEGSGEFTDLFDIILTANAALAKAEGVER